MISENVKEQLRAMDNQLKAEGKEGIVIEGYNLDKLLEVVNFKKGTKEVVPAEQCYDENGNWIPDYSKSNFVQSLSDESFDKLYDYYMGDTNGRVISSIARGTGGKTIYNYTDGTHDEVDDGFFYNDDEGVAED